MSPLARLDKINKLYKELLESSNVMEKDLSSEKSKVKKSYVKRI